MIKVTSRGRGCGQWRPQLLANSIHHLMNCIRHVEPHEPHLRWLWPVRSRTDARTTLRSRPPLSHASAAQSIWSTFFQNSSQFLAKLAPPIAREGAFVSVFRDLHDLRIFSWKLSKFCWINLLSSQKSPEFSQNFNGEKRERLNVWLRPNEITKFWFFSKNVQEKSVLK